jgi:hypothetical protein
MRAADVAVLVVGIVAISLTLADLFQSVIVPRAPNLRFRISFIVWRTLWTVWPRIAERLSPSDPGGREDFLAAFAPFALVAMLAVWAAVLVLGYGAVLWALRDQIVPLPKSYWDAAYFAGASLFTIGFGDVVGRGGFARFISLCAGASGLGVFSITTAYLFAIFGTFQRRETFIVAFAARAGSPPSAVGLYEIAAKTETRDHVSRVMREAQAWIASLMESHLAYPVLTYFRSSHDDQSWVGTLGALLDASLLANTLLDDQKHGEARICFAIGRHAVSDLSRFFDLSKPSTGDCGISREDFDRACDRLAAAGYALREREAAWDDFAKTRAEYAGPLNAMARFFHIPPVQWIGERASLSRASH